MADARFSRFKNRANTDPDVRRDARQGEGILLRKSKREDMVCRRRRMRERAADAVVVGGIPALAPLPMCTWDALPEPSGNHLEQMYGLCTSTEPPPDVCIRLTPWMIWIDSEIRTTTPARRRLMIGVISVMADSNPVVLADIEIQLLKILVEVVQRCTDDQYSLSMASYGISSLLDNEDPERVIGMAIIPQDFWVLEALRALWCCSDDMAVLWDVAASARTIAKAKAPVEVVAPLYHAINRRLCDELVPGWIDAGMVSERAQNTIYLGVDALRHFLQMDTAFPRRYHSSECALLLLSHHEVLMAEHTSIVRVAMMNVLALLDGPLGPVDMPKVVLPFQRGASAKARTYSVHEHLALHHMLIRDLMGVVQLAKDGNTAAYAVTVLATLVTHTETMALDAADTGMLTGIRTITEGGHAELIKAVFMLYALAYRKTGGFAGRPMMRIECAELAVEQIEAQGHRRAACRLLSDVAADDGELFERVMGRGGWTATILQLSTEVDDPAVQTLADAISLREKTLEDDWEVLP